MAEGESKINFQDIAEGSPKFAGESRVAVGDEFICESTTYKDVFKVLKCYLLC